MAGDWIKIEHGLPMKPEVMRLAELLQIDEMAVVGHLVCFWSWVDQNMSGSCPAARVTQTGLDRVAGRTGFAAAMVDVGWLRFVDGRIEIPNYEHHLSQSSKTRALEARRKKESRTNVPKSPGQMSGPERDMNRTREEKRREEYTNPHTPQSAPREGARVGGVGILSNLSREDLTDDGRLMRLHEGCVKAGVIDSTEAKRLLFVAEAERCLRIAKDPPAMFATNVRAGLTDRVTEDLEEAARNRLLRMRRKAARPPPIVADASAALGAKAIQLPGDA